MNGEKKETMSNKPSKDYYGYLFHWNSFTEKWNCFPREGLRDYFNGGGLNHGSGNTVKEAYNDMTKEYKPNGEINCC
jgi:hypothetical protein